MTKEFMYIPGEPKDENRWVYWYVRQHPNNANCLQLIADNGEREESILHVRGDGTIHRNELPRYVSELYGICLDCRNRIADSEPM